MKQSRFMIKCRARNHITPAFVIIFKILNNPHFL